MKNLFFKRSCDQTRFLWGSSLYFSFHNFPAYQTQLFLTWLGQGGLILMLENSPFKWPPALFGFVGNLEANTQRSIIIWEQKRGGDLPAWNSFFRGESESGGRKSESGKILKVEWLTSETLSRDLLGAEEEEMRVDEKVAFERVTDRASFANLLRPWIYLNIFYSFDTFDILGSSAMYTGNIVWYGSTKFDQEPRYLKPPFRCLDLIKCKLSKFSQP